MNLILKSFLVALVGVFLFAQTARANTLTSDTSGGSATFIEALNYDSGDRGQAEATQYNYNLGITYDHTSSLGVSDNNTQFTGGLGGKKDPVDFGLGVTYAVDPGENLKDLGANFYLGYTVTLGKSEATENLHRADTSQESEPSDAGSEGKEFTPVIGVKGTAAFLSYTLDQRLAGGGARKLRAAGLQIGQSAYGLELNAAPSALIDGKIGFTGYHYNRDVTSFVNALDSPRAVELGVGGLSTTANGFPSYMYNFSFTLYPLDAWDFVFDMQRQKSKYDGSFSDAIKLTAEHDFDEKWKGGLGAEYDTGTLVQTLGLLTVAYNF